MTLSPTNQPNSTADQNAKPVVWITGSGAPRVGRFVADEFARNGYRIVLHANRSLEDAQNYLNELSKRGVDALLVTGDVHDESFAQRSVDQITERFGQLDVLVNSAAIWEWEDLDKITAEQLKRQFDVNTLGTFLCSRAAGLRMCEQHHGGCVILIGDWAVARPYPKFASYFVSKGSIETMTRSLAVEFGTRNPNVRVNGILPGPVLLDTSISPEIANRIRNQSLVKRHGTPQDIGRAARFLAEEKFITGVCLPVDGGRSIYAGDGLDAIAHPSFPKP